MKLANDEYLKRALDVFRIVANHHVGDMITASTIQEMTSVDTRIIAKMMREFEVAGFMVITNGKGYGIARNVDEWREHQQKEYDRGLNILKKVSEAKKHRENAPTLFDQPAMMMQPHS